ncbi:primosomal protein N' [Candidatus Gracilibacteria bacterium]|nr:primosomal protein N' [Candidatus Gracilibacteria bacterium]
MLLVNLNLDKSKINKYLSNTLLKEIDNSMQNNKKVILYLNKRGEYSSLICNKCSYLYKCPNCDNSMSIHNDNMTCHLCNFTQKVPKNCEKCNSSELQKVGVGTVQIENILRETYKDKNIFRLDTDIVKNKSDKEKALEILKNAQIIIGTKMITTGFDFENVGLIGVILLEQELQIPKYNTSEKVYSNIKQLFGRGSRLGVETNFVIQTFISENELVKDIVYDNYKEFFIKTLKERKTFNYPPFCELATIEYRNKDIEKGLKYINKIKDKLILNNEKNEIQIILNPNYSKKYNQYYYKIIIKGTNLKSYLECIKTDIFKDSNLIVIFD